MAQKGLETTVAYRQKVLPRGRRGFDADLCRVDEVPTIAQRVFAMHLISAETKGDATKAAQLAGFSSPQSDGRKLMATPAVKRLIEEIVQSQGVSKREVVFRYADWMRIDAAEMEECFEDEIVCDQAGKPAFMFRKFNMAEAKRRGISQWIKSVERTQTGDKVTLHDATQAAAALARIMGMNHDKVKLRIEDMRGLSNEELLAIRDAPGRR